jgi:hypothetical protein
MSSLGIRFGVCASVLGMLAACGPEADDSEPGVPSGSAAQVVSAIQSGPVQNTMLVSTLQGTAPGDPAAWRSMMQQMSLAIPVTLATTTAVEVEPNNTRAAGTPVPALGTGAGQQRAVTVTGALGSTTDVDFIAVNLKVGDIFGANLLGTFPQDQVEVALVDPNGRLRVRSIGDILAATVPTLSPLPRGGGGRSLAYAVDLAGTYAVRIRALPPSGTPAPTGAYTLQLVAQRSPFEAAAPGQKQIVFLDFNGAALATRAEFGMLFMGVDTFLPEVSQLSPLSSFFAAFGVPASEENVVIDELIATVKENLVADIRASGKNLQFDIEVRNSRDHAEPTGPNVGKVIVGGTRLQFLGQFLFDLLSALGQANFIGISSTIDPGNFKPSDPVVVLPELISQNSALFPSTLSRARVFGRALGLTTSHEIGHMVGCFHTQPNTAGPLDEGPLVTRKENIMDPSLQDSIGFGPDGMLGTADDIDVDFGFGEYFRAEKFSTAAEPAAENTLDTVGFGLSSPCLVRTLADHKVSNRVTTATFQLPFVAGEFLLVQTVSLEPEVVTIFALTPNADPLTRLFEVLTALSKIASLKTLPAGGFGVCEPFNPNQ